MMRKEPERTNLGEKTWKRPVAKIDPIDVKEWKLTHGESKENKTAKRSKGNIVNVQVIFELSSCGWDGAMVNVDHEVGKENKNEEKSDCCSVYSFRFLRFLWDLLSLNFCDTTT